MTADQRRHRMLELSRRPGNNVCADCQDKDNPPDFISLKFGVFICIKCSGVHRGIGSNSSNVKSIMCDNMTTEMCEQMEEIGNVKAKEKWQHNVPQCWPSITKNTEESLIEQWIRAKYEREEFIGDEAIIKQPYANGSKYGWLIKKGKDAKKWNKRYFILSTKQGYLCYFLKQEDHEPKQRIHISNINIMLLSKEFTGRKHSLMLTFPVTHNGYAKQRFIYVFSDSSFDMVDWYLAIRAARLAFLRPYLYGVDKPVVDHLLARAFLKMGYLHKTGSKNGDGWKRRFVCVDTHKFYYFEKPLDAEAIDEVDIESSKMNCFAMEGVDGNHPSAPTNHCFFVHAKQVNSGRNPVYNFCAQSREELQEWLAAFRKAMRSLEWLEPIQDKSQRISLLSNFSTLCFADDE